MPKNSQADRIEDLKSLLRAAKKNKKSLPGIAPYLETLERAHHEAVAHLNRCNALRAASQEATQHLQESLAEGRDVAICVRSYIRGVLGVRSEELVQYGITPIRKRRPRRDRKDLGLGLPS